MFRQLDYSVKFPPNARFPEGQDLALKVELKAGFWAITGSNETGKSMILEMLRFLLFGTAALRGRAEDYKTLKASGSFSIKGVEYSVTRTVRQATLCRADETVASGVTAVNQKIVDTLGFGIRIFDMACSVNQGEIERLGAMTPSERKSMVDGVLGIDALEIVSKWGMEEARLADRTAETIRSRLVCPTQPVPPQDYEPSFMIPLDEMRAGAQELATIEGWLAHTKDKPTKPTCKVDLPAENIRSFSAQRAELRETVARLQAEIAVLPTVAPFLPDDIDERWAEFNRYGQALVWLATNPKPEHPRQRLAIFQDDWSAIGNIARRATLQRQIETLRAKGAKPCPHCSEDIALEADEIDRIQAAHDAVVVPNDGVVPPTPPLSMADIDTQLRHWSTFSEKLHAEMSAVPAVDAPSTPLADVPVIRAQHAQVQERAAKTAELAPLQTKLSGMPDYEQMLVERTAYEAALPVYREQLAAYDSWIHQKVEKQNRAAVLQGVRERLLLAEAAHVAATAYEAALARFGADYDTYTSALSEADALEETAKQHRAVRDAMTTLRSLIKQHLMPSLNRVASRLLFDMTGGQRSLVAVDEDFNVMIDGQDLDTLSGSGKACANLALRIALGQVLTNRVFSVLLADEIDASMDEFRAGETSNVLCTLGTSISQVLQVSHKTIESVNSIDLGETLGLGSH